MNTPDYKREKQPAVSGRYDLIDALRGITIISMVLFHFCYDVFVAFGRDPEWYFRTGPHIWQQTICWSFILISGFVWSWGQKANLRRGIFINLCGFLVTAVTILVMPSETIWFGVLNFIGCAILLMIPLHHIIKKCSACGTLAPSAVAKAASSLRASAHPPEGFSHRKSGGLSYEKKKILAAAGILICFILFLFFRNVSGGTVGFGSLVQIRLPEALYTAKILTPLGFPYPEFRSADYFPLLPWFFLYLCGWFGSRVFLNSTRCRKARQAAHTYVPFLTPLGRKSLLIYLLHQPVCYLIAMLLF